MLTLQLLKIVHTPLVGLPVHTQTFYDYIIHKTPHIHYTIPREPPLINAQLVTEDVYTYMGLILRLIHSAQKNAQIENNLALAQAGEEIH